MIEAAPGEEVTLETRDANDLQIHAGTTAKDLEKLERTVAHPLTGPVYVKGAEPGDLLEIEYLDIVPERYGWTRFAPGGGFLPDLFDYHFVAHWDITPEYATSPQLPGVRIPNGAFMGTAGVAPSHEQLKKWTCAGNGIACARRARVPAGPGGRGAGAGQGRGGGPAHDSAARELRQRGREAADEGLEALRAGGGGRRAVFGGRRALRAGRFGVLRHRDRDGGHRAWCASRLHKGEARAKNIVWPRFSHPGFFQDPKHAMPRNFIATMGMPITAEGRNENCDISLAARNAVLEMIKLLQERGWTREQAYVLCSVAVDLRVSNVVDVPNVTVSALLPEDIFTLPAR